VLTRLRTSLRRRAADDRGQGSVEFVAAVPVVLFLGLGLWQAVLAGHALWMCANAARVAARADVVERDPLKAARSALPKALERGLRVQRRGTSVRVSLRVPLVLRRGRSPLTVAASASLRGAE
jgi:hypothetical protein